nr:hypothetical protein [Streptomyces cellostaticus]
MAASQVVGEVDEGVGEAEGVDGGLPLGRRARHARGDLLRLGGQACGPQQQ